MFGGIFGIIWTVLAFVFLKPLCLIFGATENILPYVRGSVSQKTYALTDKNLVYHVVKGIDNQSYDTGNGIACKQFSSKTLRFRVPNKSYSYEITTHNNCFDN